MAIERKVPGEIRIFLNHVYEFKKGIRNMVLYTMNKEHEAFAIQRLEKQNIRNNTGIGISLERIIR